MEVANEGEGEIEDTPMAGSSANSDSPRDDTDPPANKKLTRMGEDAREASVDMLAEESTASTLSHNAYCTPQSGTSSSSVTTAPTGQVASDIVGGRGPAPPMDEQIAIITKAAQAIPDKDNQKGYVISFKWLIEAQERGTSATKSSKEAREEVQPPVDNKELVDTRYGELVDAEGNKFHPLKPALELGRDFQILPAEAWRQIVQWYGYVSDSPEIVRWSHNTSANEDQPNYLYELNPPIFTILKLPWNPDKTSMDVMRQKDKPPVYMVASRHDGYQEFLRRAKTAALVPIDTRVRLWKTAENVVTTSSQGAMPTPAQSRSNSPAPGTVQSINLGNKLNLDVNTFIDLPEGAKELIAAKDESNNKKYNGSSTLDFFGLGRPGVLVLEEQISGPAGGEWVSDAAKTTAGKHGLLKSGLSASSTSLKVNSTTASGRASPAPTGMMTRGRAKRNGRTRGVVGLGNLGNTCYMNSALQCVRSVKELTYYFLEGKYKQELNPRNPLAHNGDVAKTYATLLREIYAGNPSSISPRQFKQTIGKYGPAFSGYGQQDSQEFLLFLLDGLQEDLNRIHQKPYIEKPDSTDEMVDDPKALKQFADRCWEIYKARNDSVITDLFAGMYKSTVKCPTCDKVSIIFDPFNNLTLQLPIENLWSRQVYFFPVRSRPITVDIDIDKNSTFYQLKEYVANKFGADPKKIVMSEIYKHRFFKMFDDSQSLGEERMAEGDVVALFEVEHVPTNYPPQKKKGQGKVRSMISMALQPDSEEEEEDSKDESSDSQEVLVPVFNRVVKDGVTVKSYSKALVGVPWYITLTKEEASDDDEILRKILMKLNTLTTRDFLSGNDDIADDANEDEDMVMMNPEDADSSSESKVQADSVQSEDGMVDISVSTPGEQSFPTISYPPQTAEKASKLNPKVLRAGEFIDPDLRRYFDIHILRENNEAVPTGWSSLQSEGKDFPALATRVQQYSQVKPRKEQRSAGEQLKRRIANNGSPSSSEAEGDGAPASRRDSETNSTDDEGLPRNSSTEAVNGGFSRFNRKTPRTGKQGLITYGKKGRRQRPLVAYDGTASDTDNKPISKRALIKAGQGIVLDWNVDKWDELFGADEGKLDPELGNATWAHCPHHSDPDLQRARAERKNKRKNGVSLDDCLDEFGKEEILSENDAWYCPRCKEHRRASKKFELWTIPDVLVIHLKRFASQGRLRDKLDLLVDFPIESLDMTTRVKVNEDGRELIYDLIAVDNHYGGLGGGHYTAFVKSFDDDQWYDYNDSMASRRSNAEQAISSAAYILFYRRRSSAALGGPTFEEIVQEAEATGEELETHEDSRNQSPSAAGEGRRLGDSSRGFSSASHGAEAAHQAGNGGIPIVTRGGVQTARPDDDEELPSYEDDSIRQTTEMDMDPFPNNGPYWGETAWGFGSHVGQDGVSSTGADSGNEDQDDSNGMAFSNLQHPSTPDIQVSDHEGDTQPINIPNWGGEDDANEENDVAEINFSDTKPE